MELRLPKTRGMLRREAANWLARLQSGRDPDVERKFERWRKADPRHAEAFNRVRRSYERAGLLRHSHMVASGELEPASTAPRWQPRPALAAAAAVIVLVPIAALLVRTGELPFGSTDTVMLMTAVGEIREVSLADGSKVTLDTSTKVDVEIGRSRRSARLRYGRARFRIAPAATPFLVETASAKVSARQGVIDVDQGAGQDRVEVLAGAADVRRSDQRQTGHVPLAAGQSLTIDPGGAERMGAVTPGPDWTRGMLQFDRTTLADAVALANRYSDRHIVLAGNLSGLRVTGAFRAGDTGGLAKALAAAFGLSLRQDPSGNLILSRSASARPQNKTGG